MLHLLLAPVVRKSWNRFDGALESLAFPAHARRQGILAELLEDDARRALALQAPHHSVCIAPLRPVAVTRRVDALLQLGVWPLLEPRARPSMGDQRLVATGRRLRLIQRSNSVLNRSSLVIYRVCLFLARALLEELSKVRLVLPLQLVRLVAGPCILRLLLFFEVLRRSGVQRLLRLGSRWLLALEQVRSRPLAPRRRHRARAPARFVVLRLVLAQHGIRYRFLAERLAVSAGLLVFEQPSAAVHEVAHLRKVVVVILGRGLIAVLLVAALAGPGWLLTEGAAGGPLPLDFELLGCRL